MSDERRNKDDIFGERLGRVLRKPEHLSDDFEDELVDAIRADRPIDGRVLPRVRTFGATWWQTPITVRLSPIAALAMAASVAAIAALTALSTRPRAAAEPRVVAQVVHDTVNVVRFVFMGDAKSVSLVGDFNAWGADATPLVPNGNAWTVSVPLQRGRYEYAFIVDGKRWVADPFAPASSDEFDTRSSIVVVGSS